MPLMTEPIERILFEPLVFLLKDTHFGEESRVFGLKALSHREWFLVWPVRRSNPTL